MTIEGIINKLAVSGKNTKGEVLKALRNANLNDLYELKESINILIRQECAKGNFN